MVAELDKDGDQRRTRRQVRLPLRRPGANPRLTSEILLQLNLENLRKLFGTQGLTRERQASEKANGVACSRFSLSISSISARTFRPRWLAICREQAGCFLGNNIAVYPVGRQRSGTCTIHESLQCEILLPVSFIPSAFWDSDSITCYPSISASSRLTRRRTCVTGDVTPLTFLIVNGHRVGCQRLETRPNVDLGAAGDKDTYVCIGVAQTKKIIHDLQNIFAWRGNARSIGTFIEVIHYNIHRALPGECEYMIGCRSRGGTERRAG
jgi:hypothetical protein